MTAKKRSKGKSVNKGGRPSKIKTWIRACEKMFKEKEGEIFIYTDDELLFFINETLPEKEQIAERTFQLWKEKAVKGDFKNLPNEFTRFLRLLKKALAVEKQNLMKQMQFDNTWQRWAWILERKFSEWNLKQLSESRIDQKTQSKIEIEIIEHGKSPKNTMGTNAEANRSLADTKRPNND